MNEFLINHLVELCLMILLSIATVTDIKHHKIPNKLILFGILLGLFSKLYILGLGGLWPFLKGFSVGFFLFLPFYYLGGMAAGDVKLLMVIGGLVGIPVIYSVAIYSIFCGALIAILFIIRSRNWMIFLYNMYLLISSPLKSSQAFKKRLTLQESAYAMPYAPAIALGTLFAFYKPFFA